ncbi:MAG: phycobiliprotein lyase, partial [Spirulina sp. SIO3F2]|nr:phycobiliprotein lyase [Spirulina sp. SIO3F2]
LCEQCSVAAEQVWGALQTQWDSAKVDPYKSPEQGQALFVLLKGENEMQGRFIRSGSNEIGECCLDANGVLTLTQLHEGLTLCDRLWFATENLRFRTGLVEQNGKISHTSFYSEIRRKTS